MGAYSPSRLINKDLEKKIINKIINPTLVGLKDFNIKYNGFLYAGLMIKNNEPYLIEYNVRLGDPECQAVLARIKNNFLDICIALKKKNIKNIKIKLQSAVSSCVVIASKGYPESYEKGKQIKGIELYKNEKNIKVYHAGTKKNDKGNYITNGGRVLNIVSKAKNIKKSLELTYSVCSNISWKGSFFRKDIGS